MTNPVFKNKEYELTQLRMVYLVTNINKIKPISTDLASLYVCDTTATGLCSDWINTNGSVLPT